MDAATQSLVSGESQLLLFIFNDGQLVYAIPPTSVLEVVGKHPTTPVPFTPPWVDGVIVVRGQVVPVLDLSAFFGLPPGTPEYRDRLIIIGMENHIFAVWSDRIVGVEAVEPEKLEIPLANLPDLLLRCCKNHFRFQEFIVNVIDLQRLRVETRNQVSAD